MTYAGRRTWPLAVCAVAAVTLWLLLPDGAFGLETQLAGIRLGDHGNRLMDVHGPPDGIVVGVEKAAAAGEGAEGEGEEGEPGFPGAIGGGGEEEEEEEPSEEGEEGEEGGEAGVAGAAGGGPMPTWALPLWVELRPGETEWIYNGSKNPRYKSPVVLGFVLDRDGFVSVISLAGRYCSYAATAGNDPGKRVKLGDAFGTVFHRYGQPDEYVTFSAAAGQVAQPFTGEIAVQFTEGGNVFSRDLVLRYTERSNVAFTLHEMAVTRIHIWSTE